MATTNPSRFSWLTSEFLENILKSSENNQNVKVNDFVLQDAVAKGENYTSYLMRVIINYTDGIGSKQTSLVIKTILESEQLNEILKNCGLFDKEIAFYRDILPKFKKYADIIDKDFLCAPKCYAVSVDPTYIVFEDLKAQNFRNMNRRIGLDFNATAMVMQKLAKMHAINAMIYEESPELCDVHKLRIVSAQNPALLMIFSTGMQTVKDVCQKWPGYEHFASKFEPILNNILEIVESTYSKGENTFNTLIHGDLWANNIMFRFDKTNTTPIDVRFVDFQVGYYGPPAIDLSYLFYSSTSNDVIEEDWDRLLKIYHTELVAALTLFNYPRRRIPSLAGLEIQMLKKSMVGVMVSLSAIAGRQISNETEADLDVVLTDKPPDQLKNLYDKPEVYKRLQYMLDFYDRKGLFQR